MKIKGLTFLASILPLLFGCTVITPKSSSSWQSSSTSSSYQPATPAVIADGVYNFYGINDFHGSITEQTPGYYEAGIAKYFGKLKSLKEADPEHTIIISAGDMWQGSLESNSNYCELVTKAMNLVGFDAMTLGNHEFDYGQERLLANEKLAQFPFLGGNIMKYDGHTTDEPWNDAIKASTIIERGGTKIGIVGMIGYGQTTSITSSYVQDIDFVEPHHLAAAECKRLRDEEGCGLVIYSYHDDASTCSGADLTSSGLFNGVFCGHAHAMNNTMANGVPFVQSYCNGEAISHFQITIQSGIATCTRHGLLRSEDDWEEDEEIATLRDEYILDEAFVAKASAVAGTVQGTLYAKEGVSNLGAKAIYEKYRSVNEDVVCAIENGQRASLTGTITYHDIYRASPFMNKIVIAKVLGSEIENEARYASCYRGDRGRFISSVTYTIACIDYVLYHQNEQKRYDYFPSLNEKFDSKIIAEYEDFPFDIAFDYIKDDLQGVVLASDYTDSSPGFGNR